MGYGGAACFMLAAVYFLIWCTKRTEWARLFFALAAAGSAGFGMCELWMMHVRTPAEYGTAVRWVQLPIWVLVVSLVGFVRAGRGSDGHDEPEMVRHLPVCCGRNVSNSVRQRTAFAPRARTVNL